MKSIIILHSYHHNNTRKVAEIMGEVLKAKIESPLKMEVNDLKDYDFIGFGAGIDSGKHYKELLDFVDKLLPVENKKCFIFSTSAVQGQKKVAKDHSRVRDTLKSKGYIVVSEFSCKGHNTNLFLKYIGGMNKNRPNEKDLQNAKDFALKLIWYE